MVRGPELDDLREQLREARETLEAIRTGAVDALVLGSPGEERVFALAGADRPYRLLVEAMHEGAATISPSGVVLYANARLAELAGRSVSAIVATPALGLVAEADRPTLAGLLAVGVGEHAEGEFDLPARGGEPVGVRLSAVGFDLDGTVLRSLIATDLTERRRSQSELVAAHARLRDSEALLRTALDAVLEGTSIASAIRDGDGRIVDFRIDYANPAMARLGRVPVADQVGRSLLELFPAHVGSGRFAAYARVVETGVPFEAEDFHYADPDSPGGPLDQYLDIRAVRLGDGYVLAVRDVTERRAAAERLRESEYFFRETQRAASVGSYRATFAEDRWESSEVLDSILGIDADYPRTVAGWLDLVHPDDRAGMERYLRSDIIERRRPFDREYRIVRPSDGATRWVFGLGAVGLDPAGRVATLAGTIQDVTARAEAASEMRRLSVAIEQSADAVVITNRAAEIEYVNPAFERVSGYRRDEVLGKNPRILQSGAHGPAFYESMWATLTRGEPFAAEMTNRRRDGSLYTEAAVISPVCDPGGAITSYVAVKRDVTRERVRETALSRLAAERQLIASALADVRPGPTPEATATSICELLLRIAGVSAASLYVFARDGKATPLAFVVKDGGAVPLRALPIARARTIRRRAELGPWVESWVSRPWHPSNKLFADFGVTALAGAPIRHDGGLVGVLEVASSAPGGETALTDSLPALLELAGLTQALIGPLVAELTEAGSARDRVASIVQFGAFRPVYQPIVDVSTGVPVGYEALTRFTDRRAPDLVFAAAHAAGLGVALELATLAQAIESAAVLPGGAWLSLNVSPSIVMHGPDLARLLRRARRPVVLEITEHEPIDDYAALLDRIGRIRPNVRIAVDDAGAGVANFSHIVELRPAFVKLDIGIIRGIDTDRTRQALVLGLLHFAKESSTVAIAEGVETAAELATLRGLGVSLVQGYLLGRPAPAADLSDYVRQMPLRLPNIARGRPAASGV